MTALRIQEVGSTSQWQDLLKNNTLVVVDFWAPWCGPCRTLAPVFDQVSQDPALAGVTFCKINIDTCPDVAGQYQVLSIPTMIVVRDGAEVDRKIGGMDGVSLTQWVQKWLG